MYSFNLLRNNFRICFKRFGFIKKVFIGSLSVCTIWCFGESLVSNSKIKCVSLNNHPCQAKPTLTKINSEETLFYQFTVSVSKCDGSCNTIDDPYARVKKKAWM